MKIRLLLYFSVCILMFSCKTQYTEINGTFSGGFGTSAKKESQKLSLTQQQKSTASIENTELPNEVVVAENVDVVGSECPSKKESNFSKIKLNMTQKLLPIAKSTKREIQQKMNEPPKEKSRVVNNIFSVLGLLLMTLGLTLAAIGGNSGNYYLIGMIAGILVLTGLAIFIMASHWRLGRWGKIGLLLILLGIITFGITAIVGVPMWIYGLITGE